MRAATRPGASARTERYAAALAWLARFPLLADAQLEALLGADAADVRAITGELRARRLIASVVADSPGFRESLRLHYLADAGIVASVEQARITDGARTHWLPVAWDELLARLTRVETAVSVAGFVAMLVDDLRDRAADATAPTVKLDEAWSTPWVPRRPHSRPIAPPGVEACLRLRMGTQVAACFLTWDRAGAPPLHRRLRLADWYRAEQVENAPWGERLPTLLLVCPHERLIPQWLTLAERGAVRPHREPLALAVTTVGEMGGRGPMAARWWGVDGGRLMLPERLCWLPEAATEHRGPASPLRDALDGVCRDLTSDQRKTRPIALGLLAQHAVRSPEAFTRLTDAERWAALSLGLSWTQQMLLGWVAHHPLLPVAHLAVYLGLSERAIEQLMAGLVRCGLVQVDGGLVRADTAGPRSVLTVRGVRYLAARDGAPWRRYLQDGVLAADDVHADDERERDADGETDATVPYAARVRLADLRRHPEHTVGVQWFALALAREAAARRTRGEDCRLLVWLSAAEAQEWFRHDGRTWHVLPDARFRLRLDGTVYDLLVEWDRGLVRRRDYARKLASYAAYFADCSGAPDGEVRLVVITTETAVERVQAELAIAARSTPRLLTATRLLPMAAVRERRIIRAVQ